MRTNIGSERKYRYERMPQDLLSLCELVSHDFIVAVLQKYDCSSAIGDGYNYEVAKCCDTML